MTHTTRLLFSITLFAVLAFQSANAEFDMMSAEKVAASKLFNVNNGQVSTYEVSNLSLPIATSSSSIFTVASTMKTTAVQYNAVVPKQFELSQNFPNPFNMSTKILYSIPVQSNVSLTVYDITGREIATLVHGQVEAGTHAVNFSIDNIASGAYYYRMVATSQSGASSVDTKKMIVMK